MPTSSPSRPPVLRASHIAKSFAGVHALLDASLDLRAGEVHALVGENGAGKSTLIRVLTGAVRPDAGEIEFNGERLTEHSPSRARSLGMAAIYQQPALFPELTVAENLAIGVETGGWWSRVDWAERRRRALNLLQRVGARIDPDADAKELSMPEQQLVEIARALGAKARVLVLDEPTASLGEADTQNLFRVLRELRADGVGMIYISHRLEELPLIADRVTVLRDGVTVDTRATRDVNREQLIQLMVGRELATVFPKRTVPIGDTTLELRDVCCGEAGVNGVTFAVRAGEILGIAGLVGAGRTELARTLFGLTPADGGQIRFRGAPVTIRSPSDAMALGIAYVPEDRRRHGVVLPMTIASNMTIAALDQFGGPSPLSTIDLAEERQIAADMTRRLEVKTPSIHATVNALSGGNQQKVALSRWLVRRPSLLVLDEPTQGIDVGAKSEIHSLMVQLAEQGVAILMISSELPEILGMSDRIVVMHGGTVVDTIDRCDATPERILASALGSSAMPADVALAGAR